MKKLCQISAIHIFGIPDNLNLGIFCKAGIIIMECTGQNIFFILVPLKIIDGVIL